MSIFTKKEIIEYQVKKWNELDSWKSYWKSYLKDTNYFIQGMIEDEPPQINRWLNELVSCYDLENLKTLK